MMKDKPSMKYDAREILQLEQQGESASLAEHQRALYALLCEFDRVCGVLEIPYFLFAGTLLGAVRHEGFIPWDDDLDVAMRRVDYDRFIREAPAVLNREAFYLQAEFSDHWPMFFSKLRLNGTACLETHHPKDPLMHQGVYMDIFPCDNAFNSLLGQKLQFLCSKVIIAKGLYKRGYSTGSRVKKAFMTFCRMLPGGVFFRFVLGPKKTGEYVHSFFGGSSRFARSVYPAACFASQIRMPFVDGMFLVPAGYDSLLRILYGDYQVIPPEEDRRCKQHAILVDLKHSYECYEHYRDGMVFDDFTRSIR